MEVSSHLYAPITLNGTKSNTHLTGGWMHPRANLATAKNQPQIYSCPVQLLCRMMYPMAQVYLPNTRVLQNPALVLPLVSWSYSTDTHKPTSK